MGSASRQNQYYYRSKERMKHDEEFRKKYNENRRNLRANRLVRKLYDINFDMSKADSGLCCYIDCTTVLSIYNTEPCCGKHQRMVVRDGYYEILEAERSLKFNGSDL